MLLIRQTQRVVMTFLTTVVLHVFIFNSIDVPKTLVWVTKMKINSKLFKRIKIYFNNSVNCSGKKLTVSRKKAKIINSR